MLKHLESNPVLKNNQHEFFQEEIMAYNSNSFRIISSKKKGAVVELYLNLFKTLNPIPYNFPISKHGL